MPPPSERSSFDNSKPYWQKLKDPRWQKKRLKILERAEFSCERCGKDKDTSLHIDHSYYEKSREPWDYPEDSLHCYCEDCHALIERIRDRIKKGMAKLDFDDLIKVMGFVEGKVALEALRGNEDSDDPIEVVLHIPGNARDWSGWDCWDQASGIASAWGNSNSDAIINFISDKWDENHDYGNTITNIELDSLFKEGKK